jgi:hypothetical protein
MAQSKKQSNELRSLLLKSGAVTAGSSVSLHRTTDPEVSRHNAIMSRRMELNKVPVPAVSAKKPH